MGPYRQQPTRLPCPWDSPGKNTGVGYHFFLQCMKAKSESEVAQSCATLRDPMDCRLPGSSVHGIFQARVLEWVAISFSNAWKWKVKVKSLSRVWPFKTPWTVDYQAPPSMGFSRQEYWSGLPWMRAGVNKILNHFIELNHIELIEKVSTIIPVLSMTHLLKPSEFLSPDWPLIQRAW